MQESNIYKGQNRYSALRRLQENNVERIKSLLRNKRNVEQLYIDGGEDRYHKRRQGIVRLRDFRGQIGGVLLQIVGDQNFKQRALYDNKFRVDRK